MHPNPPCLTQATCKRSSPQRHAPEAAPSSAPTCPWTSSSPSTSARPLSHASCSTPPPVPKMPWTTSYRDAMNLELHPAPRRRARRPPDQAALATTTTSQCQDLPAAPCILCFSLVSLFLPCLSYL